MLTATNADIALLNSGTLRSDRVHPKGEFRIRDLLSILPFPDLLVVIEVSGWLSCSTTAVAARQDASV